MWCFIPVPKQTGGAAACPPCSPRPLSHTDGSNHLPRCPSPPALSSSLFLCNKINSLPGPLLPLLLFHIFFPLFPAGIRRLFFSFCRWICCVLVTVCLFIFSVVCCLRKYVVFGRWRCWWQRHSEAVKRKMFMTIALLRLCLCVSVTGFLTHDSHSQS